MYRIDNATAATVLPTPASVGPNPNGFFQVGVPGVTPSTVVDGDWANAVQEEIVTVLATAGITPSKTVRTQLVQAVKRVSGGDVTTISSSGTTLTADNAGIVLVNASGGNISMTLPASASANGLPLAFHFARTDTTANTVSIALNAADTLLFGGGIGPISLGLNGVLSLFGDGISHWLQDRTPGGVQVFTSSGTFIVPAPVIEVEVWAGGSGSWASVSGWRRLRRWIRAQAHRRSGDRHRDHRHRRCQRQRRSIWHDRANRGWGEQLRQLLQRDRRRRESAQHRFGAKPGQSGRRWIGRQYPSLWWRLRLGPRQPRRPGCQPRRLRRCRSAARRHHQLGTTETAGRAPGGGASGVGIGQAANSVLRRLLPGPDSTPRKRTPSPPPAAAPSPDFSNAWGF